MKIYELIIDGFKTYARRTLIGPFDASFNAITGRNGSGKSNILDAINFALCQTKTSAMRCENLQQLVYKSGQAGITKASVTIVFDNSDPSNSPTGYEDCDRITVTRQILLSVGRDGTNRNKYLINGTTVQRNQVMNLYRSVQLNIENPTFLIQQGLITGVVNMKPAQVRAKLEETAGTSLYDEKRANAVRVLDKKQVKLDECDRVLANDIVPALERRRREVRNFEKFNALKMKGDKLERVVIAFEYHQNYTLVISGGAKRTELEEKSASLQQQIVSLMSEIGDTKSKLLELSSKAAKSQGPEFQALEAEVESLAKERVKLETTLAHQREAAEAEATSAEKWEAASQRLTEQLAAKEAERDALVATMTAAKEEQAQLKERLVTLQQQQESTLAGVSTDASGPKSFTDQLIESKREASEAGAVVKQCQTKIRRLEAELKRGKKELKSVSKDLQTQNEESDRLRQAQASLQAKVESLSFDSDALTRLEAREAELRPHIAQLRDTVSKLSQGFANVRFDYKRPTNPNFRDEHVKGPVARLIRILTPEAATALEVVAGSRLYNVVVETADTGRMLLKEGRLRRRKTFIPLDTIDTSKIPPKVVSRAKQLVGEKHCHLALELVGYKAEVGAAMDYVFGRTLVCDSSEAAKRVTFDRSIRSRSVTYEGDVYDPSGTLTGGSCNTPRRLAALAALIAAEDDLHAAESELAQVREQLRDLEDGRDAWATLSQELELKSHELTLLEQRQSTTSSARVQQGVAQTQAALDATRAEMQEAQQRHEAAQERSADLTSRIASFASEKEALVAGIRDQIKSVKAAISAAKTSVAKHNRKAQAAIAEVDTLTAEHQEKLGAAAAAKAASAPLAQAVAETQAQVEELVQHLDAKEQRLAQWRAKAAKWDKRAREVSQQQAELMARHEAAQLEHKEAEHQLAQLGQEHANARRHVAAMERAHPWIERERDLYGKSGTEFDFAQLNVKRLHAELTSVRREQAHCEKSINKKVVSMMQATERQYEELMGRKATIEQNKRKIEASIRSLDRDKKVALRKTYEKVNADFDAIFTTLLPGTHARLEPVEGSDDIMDGLEIRVAFGNVWKDSLAELSGGQRSLLALSFILALCRYKPAPVYILDEVDSALDLSHTENIGSMFRTHFKASQFIIVSLKPGMFKNASVLFQTRLMDGVSSITRKQGSAAAKAARKAKQSTAEQDAAEGNWQGGATAPRAKKHSRGSSRRKKRATGRG